MHCAPRAHRLKLHEHALGLQNFFVEVILPLGELLVPMGDIVDEALMRTAQKTPKAATHAITVASVCVCVYVRQLSEPVSNGSNVHVRPLSLDCTKQALELLSAVPWRSTATNVIWVVHHVEPHQFSIPGDLLERSSLQLHTMWPRHIPRRVHRRHRQALPHAARRQRERVCV